MRFLIILQIVVVLALRGAAQGQTPAPASPGTPERTGAASQIMGEVTSIDVSRRMILRTSSGSSIAVLLDDKTEYLRLPPGETTLKNKEVITLSAISIGDRVMARSKSSPESSVSVAHQIIVMSRSAIIQKQEHDRADWLNRGIVGTITALNSETKDITLMARSSAGDHQVSIAAGAPDVKFRRYPPDSSRLSDSKPSSFTELRIGDQLRALGTRSPDRKRLTPEQIVSGSFRTAGGPVLSVDSNLKEIRINNLQTGQPLIIVVNAGSIMRRVTPEAVAILTRQRPPAAGSADRDARSVIGNSTSVVRNGNPQEVIDHLPSITLGDLKPGDVVVVLSTVGSNPSRIVAMMLASGAAPLLAPAKEGQASRNKTSITLGLPGGVLDGAIGLP